MIYVLRRRWILKDIRCCARRNPLFLPATGGTLKEEMVVELRGIKPLTSAMRMRRSIS